MISSAKLNGNNTNKSAPVFYSSQVSSVQSVVQSTNHTRWKIFIFFFVYCLYPILTTHRHQCTISAKKQEVANVIWSTW